MAYIELNDLKDYLGIALDNETDDELLEDSIASAQRIIESITHKVFESENESIHYFTYGKDTDDRVLYFDQYLATEDDLAITNGDGTVLTDDQFTLINRNNPPYIAVKLKLSANTAWTYSDTPEDAIEVEGHWAWSVEPPDDIKRATMRYAAYLYRQKDAQQFDSTAFNELGVIKIKHVIPGDILQIIARYIPLGDW